MEIKETKKIVKQRPWACGFDIRDPANWPKVVEKLKENDKAILEDFAIYFRPMLEKVDDYARPTILQRFDKKLFRTAMLGYGVCFEDKKSVFTKLYMDFVDYYQSLELGFWESFKKNRDEIDNINNFRHFANRLELIFFNLAIDDIIRPRRRNVIEQRTSPVGDFIQKVADDIIGREDPTLAREFLVRFLLESIHVDREMKVLSDQSKKIIWLKFFRDFTLEEIAEETKCTVPTVIKRYRRNIKHLEESHL
jgi:RNA polymerase sigma factor (sigma-70 family)